MAKNKKNKGEGKAGANKSAKNSVEMPQTTETEKQGKKGQNVKGQSYTD